MSEGLWACGLLSAASPCGWQKPVLHYLLTQVCSLPGWCVSFYLLRENGNPQDFRNQTHLSSQLVTSCLMWTPGWTVEHEACSFWGAALPRGRALWSCKHSLSSHSLLLAACFCVLCWPGRNSCLSLGASSLGTTLCVCVCAHTCVPGGVHRKTLTSHCVNRQLLIP